MSYLIGLGANPRRGLRGDLSGATAASTFGIAGGSGSVLDPFGGIGGASEAQLAALSKAGLTFSAPPNASDIYQTGTFNGEAYVFVKCSDSFFYKFKYPNSGIGNTPSKSATIAWFDDTVARNRPGASASSASAASAGVATPIKLPKSSLATPPISLVGPNKFIVQPGTIAADAAGRATGQDIGLDSGPSTSTLLGVGVALGLGAWLWTRSRRAGRA